MLGSQCTCLLQRLGSITCRKSFYYTYNSVKGFSIEKLLHVRTFCSKAKVPPDVLKSNADEFSGKKSILFESEEVQTILKRMTSINLPKIFKTRKENLSNPVYKVLDDEQIKMDEEAIVKDAEKHLVMPPVRELRKPIDVVLSRDPELIHNDEDGADYVFTDISPSKDLRTRAVLVRENATGVLREASWDERDLMQFIYWPKEGQTYEIAPMLQDEHLPIVLDQMRHQDILDFINIQCEPDSPDYIRVTHLVYEDILNRDAYDILNSTRYYGGMLFYYISNQKTNKILGYFLRNGQVEDAGDIIRLHFLVHGGEYDKDLKSEELARKYIHENGMDSYSKYLDVPEEAVAQ